MLETGPLSHKSISMGLAVFLVCAVFCVGFGESSPPNEPQCLSRFDYDFKMVQKMAQLEREQQDLRNLVTTLGTAKTVSGIETSAVAFNAYLRSKTEDLQAGTTIAFNGVTLNIGSCYNPYHGVFTAKIPGLYFFTATLATPNVAQIWLIKNQESFAYSFVNEDKWGTGTASATLELAAGDRVWVEGQHVISGEAATCPPHKCIHSTFTGFLIADLRSN